MGGQMLNYVASVTFGALAIALLFACGYVGKSDFVMKAALFVAAVSWLACYVGTFPTPIAYSASLALTIVACIVYLVAFIVVLM